MMKNFKVMIEKNTRDSINKYYNGFVPEEVDGYIFDDPYETDYFALKDACKQSVLRQVKEGDTVELYTNFIGLAYLAVIEFCRNRKTKIVKVYYPHSSRYKGGFQVETYPGWCRGDCQNIVHKNDKRHPIKLGLDLFLYKEVFGIEEDIFSDFPTGGYEYDAARATATNVLKFFKKFPLEIFVSTGHDMEYLMPVVDACRELDIFATFHVVKMVHVKENTYYRDVCESDYKFSLWSVG